MNEPGLAPLLATAGFVGLIHTVTGPDHYLPFVAMSQAGHWSLRKSLTVTACCGVGHVASSIALGLAGLMVSAALSGLVAVEEFRGTVAGWLLVGFGLGYAIWALRRQRGSHSHHFPHLHRVGTVQGHLPAGGETGVVAPWFLFLIFVFGPCEPLVPLLMYPAATTGLGSSVLVATVFAIATIGTMMAVVTLARLGLGGAWARLPIRYAHVVCGVAIAACGVAVCLGL